MLRHRKVICRMENGFVSVIQLRGARRRWCNFNYFLSSWKWDGICHTVLVGMPALWHVHTGTLHTVRKHIYEMYLIWLMPKYGRSLFLWCAELIKRRKRRRKKKTKQKKKKKKNTLLDMHTLNSGQRKQQSPQKVYKMQFHKENSSVEWKLIEGMAQLCDLFRVIFSIFWGRTKEEKKTNWPNTGYVFVFHHTDNISINLSVFRTKVFRAAKARRFLLLLLNHFSLSLSIAFMNAFHLLGHSISVKKNRFRSIRKLF